MIGAECRVVVMSKKSTSIDKKLGGKAPGRPECHSIADEKYQEANGVMYHRRSFMLERRKGLGSQQPTKLLPWHLYDVLYELLGE